MKSITFYFNLFSISLLVKVMDILKASPTITSAKQVVLVR